MSDQQKRFWCRVAFAFLCVIPTLYVFSLAANRVESEFVADQFYAAARLEVRFGKFQETAPGEFRIQRVEFYDLEKGTIAKLDELNLRVDATRITALGNHLLISRFGGRSVLPRLIESFSRISPKNSPAVDVQFRNVTVANELKEDLSGEQAQTFRNIVWHQECDAKKTDIWVTLAGIDVEQRKPMSFHVSTRLDEPSSDGATTSSFQKEVTTWKFSTEGESIPAWLIEFWFGGKYQLGELATFSGSLFGGNSAGDWQWTLEGTFAQVDFRTLISDNFPQSINGTGDLEFQEMTVAGGQLISCKCDMKMASGTVGKSLLTSLMSFMGLQGDVENAPEHVQVRNWHLGVALGNRQLVASGNEQRIVALDPNQVPVIWIPESPVAVSPAGLVRILSAESDVQIPFTKESSYLMGLIEAPPSSVSRVGAGRGVLRLE